VGEGVGGGEGRSTKPSIWRFNYQPGNSGITQSQNRFPPSLGRREDFRGFFADFGERREFFADFGEGRGFFADCGEGRGKDFSRILNLKLVICG
jgi:hypothetical protein